MEPTQIGVRVASSAVAPLVKLLFRQPPPGAELVRRPVRLDRLVAFRGERRELAERELRKLTVDLVTRAERSAGPHDAALPPGEREAVAEAVVRTLTGLGGLRLDDAEAVGLGPRAFAARLRESVPAATDGLSADAAGWHDRLVETAALHILEFFTRRSAFIPRALVEQTRRLEELLRATDAVREALPPGPREQDRAFEETYRESLARQHSRLTIVGVDLSHTPDSWSLEGAYLHLGVELPVPGDDAPAQVPVDQVLAGQERVLLCGNAGAGKTTLVQWLALSAAREGSGSPWQGRVPFVLPVRRFAERGFPTPDEFLAAVRHPLKGAEPSGWAVRVLTGGRALLLVDGVDEAPAERREEIRRTIDELVRLFPGNRWLVTSRPSAVAEDWLDGQDFTGLSLAPMNRDQVARFIRLWHGAAAGDTGGDRERLPEYGRRLLHSVRIIRELRVLATNPLMCGLICALNRDRNGILPRGRKALYKAALAMLLERRDPEREVHPDGIVLEREAKERLLQKLAHWMLLNDRSELDRATAVDVLDRYLPSIPSAGSQGTAEDLFDHLLERTGLLRVPTPDAGVVDFVHRTFQDYLSAKEAVERHDFPFLVNHAHNPDWDDVIRMAVSLARPDECARMLQDLVSGRTGRTPAQARYCKLLAAACVEHATETDPEIREMVRRRTYPVIRPSTVENARRLGWLGPIVLELLPEPEGLPDERALLAAATAASVRDDAAIDYLVRLRGRRSPAVRAELAGAWRRFDTDWYAREIIAHLDPEELYFTVSDGAELAALRELGGRERIRVSQLVPPEELAAGLVAERVTHLWLLVYEARRGLDWLRGLPRLRVLRLSRHVGEVHGVPEGVRVERDG